MRRTVLIAAVIAVILVMPRGHRTPSAIDDSIFRVVVVGDSVARGLASSVAGATNLGINGARTFNVLEYLRRPEAIAQLRRADAVIMSIGGTISMETRRRG